MEDLLTKIGLERFVDSFRKENITPDIICKMSLYDMRCVGVNDRTDIMNLRTMCIPYGSKKPIVVRGMTGGAPMYEILKETLEILFEIGFKISEVAKLLSVSESTVYRRMRMYGLNKMQFTDITDEDLLKIVGETLQEFPKCGELMLMNLLRQKNVKITRLRLRDILHHNDEAGVAERRHRRLHRRIYHVQCPNQIWHVDTHHKLIRWCFVVSGAVDGFSRLITVLECLDNNRAESLLEVFIRGTERFGTPQRVRTDMGMENVLIAEFMTVKRGASGILTGKSTHNQRIERLWRDVFDGVLVHFYLLFSFMEDENILDVLNPLHIFALHYVYKHKINANLNTWREAWASHRLRTVGSSPLRLWTAGVINDMTDTTDMINDLPGALYQPPNYQSTLFQPDHPTIDGEKLQKLAIECPKDWMCTNFGIDVYRKALSILTEPPLIH